MEEQKISLISGGFDPLHSGHIEYFKEASKYGDVVVLLNSDEWLTQKKGKPFMPWKDRAAVVGNLKGVIDVLDFADMRGDAIDGIQKATKKYPPPAYRVSFLNGGDRTFQTTPEVEWCMRHEINCIFDVGGDKIQSSSWILNSWEAPPTKRLWGEWRVLKDYPPSTKVKELIVYPGRQLSYQRHFHRSEYWHISEGTATVYGEYETKKTLHSGQSFTIPTGEWHQLANLEDTTLRVVEIQWGDYCEEEDIERQAD